MDLKARLVQRLDKLENHLAFVVSLHLFVENLIDALIEAKSPTAGEILSDHRSYSFAVKMTMVFNMGLIPKDLFENLRALNRLRNEYAHDIDVDLARSLRQKFRQAFVRRDRSPAFPDAGAVADAVAADPAEGMRILHSVREHTFAWLHDECTSLGITR